MSGVADLTKLLASMNPELSSKEVVFCSFPDASVENELLRAASGYFREREGVTLIIGRAEAERYGVPFRATLRAITLTVHSSLEAVGFTAAVASRLAAHGISANVMAACYHDHIFVPAPDAERALQVLQALQAEASAGRHAASSAPDATIS
jgi:uncharacterized protein